MKLIKRLLIITAVLLVLLIVAAIAIPYFMKDEIVAVIKEEANKSVNAKIDFEDVDLSLIRSFPSLSMNIDNLTVDGINEFAGVRLFKAAGMQLDLDFWSVWGNSESIPIEGFTLQSPEINILVLKDGRANWDITKSTADPTAPATEFLVELENYSIKNGHLTYEDRSMDFQMELEHLNHSGTGDFTETIFDLDTKTEIAAITASMEGMTYLRKAKADLDAKINMNIADMIFTLKENVLNLNALTIKAEGMVDMNDEAYVMDLTFNSPQNSFKNLWSIIPSAYTKDYEQAKINGSMTLSGLIKGTYNGAKGLYPAFKIDTNIDNGQVQYPDLPMALASIFTDISINSPSSDFDDMVVRIPQFEFKLDDNPFAGNFNLRTPISDPKLKTEVRGTINLADIQKAIPMEGINNLQGVIKSDFYVNAAMSQMEKSDYEGLDMKGDMTVSNLVVEQAEMPKIAIKSLTTAFSPQSIKFDNFDAILGQSDIRGSGRIFNILAYFSPEKTMDGTFVFESNYFNANEWMPAEPTTPTPTNQVGFLDTQNNQPKAVLVANEETTAVFDRFNFNIDGKIKKLDYDEYKMTNMVFDGTVNPERTTIDKFYTKIGESDIEARGTVNNLFGYALDNEILTGEIDLKSNYLDLNQFMTETAATETTEAVEVIPVPENIDLKISSDLKKVRYTNMDLKNIKGDVIVKESAAKMKDVKGKILGGSVYFDGSYDTKDLNKPKFNMKTRLASMNFEKAFETFNTFQSLAPIGKFIDGTFNTELSMSGILGKDLIPDLGSLNLDGFFHTLNGKIDGFKPFQELANKLNIDKIKNLKIRDSKNWLTVKDGFITVKEFEHKIDDMTFLIAGKHSLTQQMEYVIKARIPRKLLEKSKVTAAANQGWDFISKEAAKKGINLANGEFVNLKIDLIGSMTDPKFTIIPVAADGETSVQDATKAAVEAAVNEAVDSVKTVVDEKVTAVKEEANAVKDTVKNVINTKVEEAKEEVKETAKSTLDSIVKGGKVELPKLDSLGSGILKDSTLNKEVDKAKDKLKDLFGKKKKKNG